MNNEQKNKLLKDMLLTEVPEVPGNDTSFPVIPTSLWFYSVNDDNMVNNMFVQAVDCLEYAQWKTADRVFDNIINAEPRNASAFLGKCLAQYQLSKPEDIPMAANPSIDSDINLRKAKDYGTREQARFIEDILLDRKYIQEYDLATKLASTGSAKKLQEAAAKFDSIRNYKDAAYQADECRRKAADQQQKEDLEKQERQRINNAEKKMHELLDAAKAASICHEYPNGEQYYLKKHGSVTEGDITKLEDVLKDIQQLTQDVTETRKIATYNKIQSLEEEKKKMEYVLEQYKAEESCRKMKPFLWLLTILGDIVLLLYVANIFIKEFLWGF